MCWQSKKKSTALRWNAECGEFIFLGLGMKHGNSWKRRATFPVFDAWMKMDDFEKIE